MIFFVDETCEGACKSLLTVKYNAIRGYTIIVLNLNTYVNFGPIIQNFRRFFTLCWIHCITVALKTKNRIFDSKVFHFRQFRGMDDNHDYRIPLEEFIRGLCSYGVDMSRREMEQCFKAMDADKSGSISYQEFLQKMRVGVEFWFTTNDFDFDAYR